MKKKAESKTLLNVLCLEDDLKDAELANGMLVNADYKVSMDIATGEKEYVDFLKHRNYDIILADNSLPSFDALAALKVAITLKPEIPFICVSGTIGEEKAVELLKQGAKDYVIKDRLGRLAFAVQSSLKEVEIEKERKHAEEELLLENNALVKLNQFAIELSNLSSDENLEEFITKQVKEITCAEAAIFSEYDSSNRTTTTKHIVMDSGLLEKVFSLLGKHIQDIHSVVSEEDYRMMTNKMIGVYKTLYEASFKAIPRSVGAAIQALLNVDRIIGVAYIIEGKLYGISLLLMGKGQPDPPKEILENFVHLAALSLRRKKAEENLVESEEKFKAIFQHSNDAIMLLDRNGFFDCNLQTLKLFKIKSKEEFIKLSPAEHSPSVQSDGRSSVETVEENISIAYREGYNRFDWIHRKADGEEFNADVLLSTFDYNGEQVLQATVRDITERKKAEDAITSERRMLRTLIDNLPDGIYVKDIDCRKIIANKAEVLNNGFKKEAEVLGKTDIELFQGQTGLRGYNDDKSVISLGKTILEREEDFIDKNGVRRWLLTSKIPLQNNNGIITGLVGIGHDITGRKMAEAELLQSYVFSETLLKTIPFGMDIVDETGTVLFQSESFKEIFGKSAIGNKCWELYRDDKKQCSDCPLFKGITIGKTETYESHGVLGNRKFEISHTGMLYEGKKAMLEIFQDITVRIENEKELIRAKEKAEESDRLKSAFLTNMSHEIRTPMNGIIGFTELLKEPNLSSDDQQDFIQTIQISGARMLNTINSIVDISKIESGLMAVDIKVTNINEKTEFIHKFFKPEVETKGMQFLFKNGLSAKEAIIKTDNEKVYGILTNLVRNAIKFTYEGSIEFGYEKNGNYLEFFVKDTGVGIPKNQHELIFERFRQGSESHNRGYEGSGLGLSISKSYVEMLGGRIWVESEEGTGSTFYFTIPYNPVSEETTTIGKDVLTENKEVQIKKLKILIVEDDEISYSLLSRVVQKISKEVLHAITGLQAVEACRNNPDLDLVLMDIRMPMMNGLEATQQIRQFNKDVIIIAQTAYGFSCDSEKAIEAGCNDYISKPIDKTLLFELINKHCNKQKMNN
jgi:PAS domain S-box-containing protein